MTLFVKISDFSQIVLWRLHFPVERSAISFFYKPWVIFRHRKKIKIFRTFFLTFSDHRSFRFFRNFQINPFWKFRKFIWRFSEKIFKNFNIFFGKSVLQNTFSKKNVEIFEYFFGKSSNKFSKFSKWIYLKISKKTKTSMIWKSEKKCSKNFDFFSVSKYHPGLVEKRYGRTFYGKMKPSEHNLWKITDFDKKSHTLRGWEKILRIFFEKKYFLTRVPSISFPKNLILKDSIEGARRNLHLSSPGKNLTPPRVTNWLALCKTVIHLREETHIY